MKHFMWDEVVNGTSCWTQKEFRVGFFPFAFWLSSQKVMRVYRALAKYANYLKNLSIQTNKLALLSPLLQTVPRDP